MPSSYYHHYRSDREARAPTNRGDVSGVGHDGRLYAASGEARKMTFWAVEAFNPTTGIWSIFPHMLVARHGLAAALLADRLHVMGGGFQSHGMPDEVIDLGTQ
jgi:hypothetical protein